MAHTPFESVLSLLGAIVGLASLLISITASILSVRRAPAREEPMGKVILQARVILLASVLFVALAVFGWRPLPIEFGPPMRDVLSFIGAIILFTGASLYLWGLLALRGMFAPSSGFAVRIQADHKLVTSGPYAFVRHPMYLGVILATIGTLLLYRTWTGLAASIAMFGLAVRAKREEKVLAEEFGADWSSYASRVPMWLPFLSPPIIGGA
jgi:protein-S-isoprenylcysteine O-methyltransferase Ste14